MWIRRGDIELLLARGGALRDENSNNFFTRYGDRAAYETLLRPIAADHFTVSRLRRVIYPWCRDVGALSDHQVVARTIDFCLTGRLALVYRMRPDTLGSKIVPEQQAATPISSDIAPATPPPAPAPKAPQSTINAAAQAAALKRASDEGKPFCEVCEQQRAERAAQDDDEESELGKYTKKKADEEQQKPSKERASVVAGMQTPDGNKSSAGSLRVPREQPPDLPPKTQAAYDDVPADIKTHQNGKCAEAQAIASYERENGVLPPAGTRFDARNVRGPDSQPPPLGKHGTPKPACKMCGHVMKQNGWISETGYE